MIGELPSDETIRALENHLGQTFVIKHLHPWRVRFRRAYAQKSLALPSALKLETEGGDVYKLHVSDMSRRFDHMSKRANQAMPSGLFPRVIWQNDQAMLLEYLPGQHPRFRSKEFARELGVSMATLHKLDQRPCDIKRVKAGIDRDLELLFESGVLRKNSQQYRSIVENEFPESATFVSMDYADVRPGNFLWDKSSQLRFIDLGALRANRPSGQYLCGSFYLRHLNRGEFVKAYLHAGGLPQVIEQVKFLRMLNCIWAAALYVRKMREVPNFLPIHKLSYRFLAGYLMWEFRRLSRMADVSFNSI